MNAKQLLMGTLLLAGSLASCSSDEEANGTGKLSIRLTDAPGDYDAVNIDIKEVLVHTSSEAGEDESGWIAMNEINGGVYNLLDFSNGVDTLLAADASLPAGKISQIRLVLGDDNSVVIDGETISLKTPSAQQSGLKLKVNANLTPGVTYEVLLDFDAARSVVKAGNSGKYNLKPTIRTIVEARSGAISGQVSTIGEMPIVFATNGMDTLGAIPSASGEFLIRGASPDTYEVTFETSQTITVREGVVVSLGEVNDLGTVEVK